MNKIKFLSVLAIATLVLSACGKKEVNEGMDVNEENGQTEIIEKRSIKELMSLGVSQKCTFEIDNEGQLTKGELLINGDKFKQTIEVSSGEEVMKINSVSDGEYLYSWNEGIEGSGSKIKIEKEDIAISEENVEKAESINWEEKLNYSCSLMVLSDDDLAPPSDIEFVDLSEMMQNLQNMSPEELENLIPNQE